MRTNRIGRVLALLAAGLAATAVHGAGTARAAEGDISRFAGSYASGSSGDGGPATSAQLNGPTGVAASADGRTFIADRANNRIRVVAADGTITTLASTDVFNPVDVAVDDAAGVLYFTEEVDPFINRLSRIDISGGSTTPVVIAGGAGSGYAGDGGPASAAVFRSIAGIDVGPDGDVFIADRGNNRIRRLDVDSATISLVAGNGSAGGTNGEALAVANFSGPKDVAVAADGTVYVADEQTNLVRRISAGQVSVFAGNYVSGFGGDGGPATAASLASPDGVAVDAAGNVYVADTGNNRVRRIDIDTGTITTVAGNGACCAAGDGGAATSASVGNPIRIDVDAFGAIYIAAEPEHAVRLVEGRPLVADAGGPYAIDEGDALLLDATAFEFDAISTFAWDLDGDAAFDDAVGATPTVPVASLLGLGLADGPEGPVTISVRATSGSRSAVASSTVTVANVAPTATIDLPGPITAGIPVTIKVGALDPGPVDAAALFTYLIDWEGDGVVDDTVVGPADPPATHTYPAPGVNRITVVAVDKDGGRSVATVVTVAVLAPPTVPTSPTTVATTLPSPSGTLPATGTAVGAQAGIATLLVLLGGAALVVRTARRAN
jgi:sugar lactone lactonase YvrE